MTQALLLNGFAPGASVGGPGGRRWPVEAFVATARTLAGKLPPARFAMLLCEDRVNFALAFAALVVRGTTALLPPSHARLALVDIVTRRRPAFALVDAKGVAEGLHEIVVDASAPASASSDVPRIDGDHVAAVVYTSGTTGEPQAHEKRWISLVRGAEALRSRIGFAPGDAIVGAVPPQHMWGLEATIMLPLQSGGAIHPGTPLLPQDIAIELAAVAPPRWLVLTPVHARACVGARVSLPPLAGVLSATSPLDREAALALERLSHAPAFEIYGSTETGAIATRRSAYDDRFLPLPGVSLRQTAAGLEVQGGHVTAVTLGDRADIGRDGRFALLGRDEDQVKVAGKRASLSMLNAILRAIPGVLDAEYVQCETGGLAPRLAALVVAPHVRREAILAALRERVDPVFLPRPLHLVDALPRDAIGKIARAALATRVGEIADPDNSDEVDAP